MKTILALALTLAVFAISPALADTVCRQHGDRLVCTDDEGNTTTCRQHGDRIVCNDY